MTKEEYKYYDWLYTMGMIDMLDILNAPSRTMMTVYMIKKIIYRVYGIPSHLLS